MLMAAYLSRTSWASCPGSRNRMLMLHDMHSAVTAAACPPPQIPYQSCVHVCLSSQRQSTCSCPPLAQGLQIL